MGGVWVCVWAEPAKEEGFPEGLGGALPCGDMAMRTALGVAQWEPFAVSSGAVAQWGEMEQRGQ